MCSMRSMRAAQPARTASVERVNNEGATHTRPAEGRIRDLPMSGSHVLGVVHRDLSPDNILFSWDGAVEITDFGIAKERHKTEVSMPPQGKHEYISSEQHLGQPLNGRSDLYSVGVILWDLLAHQWLFTHGIAVQGKSDRALSRSESRGWISYVSVCAFSAQRLS